MLNILHMASIKPPESNVFLTLLLWILHVDEYVSYFREWDLSIIIIKVQGDFIVFVAGITCGTLLYHMYSNSYWGRLNRKKLKCICVLQG